ncbi:7,8-dihydropterin-6-yl-methyl-4-(beta-D-ribofuranosyl)aminobenzene 5'-phosphate synthase [Lachnospiraceae bacterium]|nr:7,8-dihydropterin-6-yl-methyl-4-(beta-D-ribofuranosyl)aminobenzene 5'-phosphate synthase [Lachnospiraceae bacterium]
MRIINLIENTEGKIGCPCAHGLSFYIETAKHKALLDLGPDSQTLENAEKLGIDLSKVDIVILSHGHYDHSGGIIPFSEINSTAVIYMQKTAGRDYYSDDGERPYRERYRYIGIDKAILNLPQIKFIDGDHEIDDELELITIKKRSHELPSTNSRLLIKEKDGFIRDDFIHEHFLVVKDSGKSILLSGCAHNGILSILDAYREKYAQDPDAVISGFHLMKKHDYTSEEMREIEDIANELKKYDTQFITCHCTGLPAYEVMKKIMGGKLRYVHTGEEVELDHCKDSR